MAETKTIIIADDDRDFAQMLTLRCKQMGLDVFRSPDAMHALMGAGCVNPSLIVLDVNMPGGNGLSVCEMLVGDEATAKVPVIIMSGVVNNETTQRCQKLGARFIEKGSGFWKSLQPMICEILGLADTGTVADPATPIKKNESSAADKPVPTNGNGVRPKILCIDDDPEISKALKLRLEPYGLDVLRAFNGMQGYWTAIDMRPDLIILDMFMPEGEGNYIFGRLRSHPLTDKVPVLVITGINTPGVRRKMFGLGVDGFLKKPIDFDSLLDHIGQYVTLKDPLKADLEAAAR